MCVCVCVCSSNVQISHAVGRGFIKIVQTASLHGTHKVG